MLHEFLGTTFSVKIRAGKHTRIMDMASSNEQRVRMFGRTSNGGLAYLMDGTVQKGTCWTKPGWYLVGGVVQTVAQVDAIRDWVFSSAAGVQGRGRGGGRGRGR